MKHLFTSALLLVGLAAAPCLQAQTIVATQFGSYDNSGFYDTGFSGYMIGAYTDESLVSRAFFSFDRASLLAGGLLQSATLSLYNPEGGFGSDSTFEFLDLRSLGILTDGTAALLDGSSGVEGFDALASGSLFASIQVDASSDDTTLQINLGQLFLDYVNSTTDSTIVVAASLSPSTFGLDYSSEHLFGGTNGSGPTPALNVTAIPEPSTYAAVFGCGVLVFALVTARRRRLAKT